MFGTTAFALKQMGRRHLQISFDVCTATLLERRDENTRVSSTFHVEAELNLSVCFVSVDFRRTDKVSRRVMNTCSYFCVAPDF